MAIVALDKITLYGTTSQKDAVLDGLQRLGCLHLLDLSEREEPTAVKDLVSADAREALRYLRACPVKRRQTKSRKGYDFAEVDARALAVKRREEQLNDERDHLRKAIADLRPWGSFRLPADQELGGAKLWFYVFPHRELGQLEGRDLTWEVISRDSQFEYVVVADAEQPEGMPVAPVELDPRPLSELETRLEEVEEELEELYWQRVALTRWCKLLAQDLNEADDRVARGAAARRALDSGEVFAVQGWCPRTATPDVKQYAQQRRLALTVEEPAEQDTPPTLLNNPERVAGAEGAVTFYLTPDYRMWDPTIVLYFSFSLFFAMIVADAGYGLVFAVLLRMLWNRLGQSRSGVRTRSFLAAIVVTTILYGVLVGSYFGMSAPPLLAPLQLLDLQDQGTMMALSIAIGVFHLVLANLITAWQARGSLRCLAPMGWAAIMLGGLLLGAAMMEPVEPVDDMAEGLHLAQEGFYWALRTLGTLGLVAGALAVFLFSSERPLSPRIGDLVGRVFDGFQALTNVTKAFGDVLSYLRLFALGLASAQLAATFNNIAAGAVDLPGPGVLLAVLIVVIGHGINIALGVMSGVVHGLRLNCIEFFNWSLKEEGYSFQAFRKKAEV